MNRLQIQIKEFDSLGFGVVREPVDLCLPGPFHQVRFDFRDLSFRILSCANRGLLGVDGHTF